MDNDGAEDRQTLIEELSHRGIEAFEYTSGGGMAHVVATLYEDGDDILMAATSSARTECEVGMMGWRRGRQAGSQGWMEAGSVEEAAKLFQDFFTGRCAWVEDFVNGRMDL